MADALRKMLHEDWKRIAESVVRKRGKKLSDLCFAKRTTTGYAFFLSKKIDWDILHEISQEVAKIFPQIEFAAIAETCSELCNSEVEEAI